MHFTSAIFGSDADKAQNLADKLYRSYCHQRVNGCNPVIAVCGHSIQRKTVISYLNHPDRRLLEINLREVTNPTASGILEARKQTNIELPDVSLYGIERSHWKEKLNLLPQLVQELRETLKSPVILWVTPYTQKEIAACVPRFYASSDTVVFKEKGALWAPDSAAALSMVEENIFSQTVQQREAWRDYYIGIENDSDDNGPLEQRDFRKLIAKQRKGVVLHTLGKFDDAKQSLDEAIKGLEAEVVKGFEAKATEIRRAEAIKGSEAGTIKSLEKKLDEKCKRELAWSYYYRGAIEDGIGDWLRAQSIYNLGLSAAKQSNCGFTKYYLQHQIHSKNKHMPANEKMVYFKDMLNIYRRKRNYKEIAHLAYHVGVIYQEMGDYELALVYYNESARNLPIWNRAWEADLALQIGSAEFARDNLKAADEHFAHSEKIMNDLGFLAGVSVVLRAKAALRSAQGNDDECQELLKQSRAIRKDLGLLIDELSDSSTPPDVSAPHIETSPPPVQHDGQKPSSPVVQAPDDKGDPSHADGLENGIVNDGRGRVPELNGEASIEVHKAILQAFKKVKAFNLFLVQYFNFDLEVEVDGGAFRYVVNEVLQIFVSDRRYPALLALMVFEFPLNQDLYDVYQKYAQKYVGVELQKKIEKKRRDILQQSGLRPEVILHESGEQESSSSFDVDSSGFEKTIRPYLSFLDVALWRTLLQELEARVCRVEVGNGVFGTGFLVGPDAVLTNHHVLASVIEKPHLASSVRLRFDFTKMSNGMDSAGTLVSLRATDWLVDKSPPAAAELQNIPGLPDSSELDYALVRIDQPLGDIPVVSQQARRGWIHLSSVEPAIMPKMPILILQHPATAALKLAIDTEGVIGMNSNNTRIRYTTNTEAGSSGSPCFDVQWKLLALHHLGDPAVHNAPIYNQGVPIWKIRKQLDQRGVASVLGGEFPQQK